MQIAWDQTQMYNTLMAVATGVALLMLVRFAAMLRDGRKISLSGWAIGFIIPGFILTLLGGVMTLTWPLSKVGFPFDDIIFGEPTLAFGAMLLGGGILLWRKSKVADDYKTQEERTNLKEEIVEMIRPLSYFAAAMGLALFSIAIAGMYFQLFAAPPEEPISGRFADYPMLEATFISGLYALTGLGAVLLPFALREYNPFLTQVIRICWIITGVLFTLFGAMNYFTHIGLIINTM